MKVGYYGEKITSIFPRILAEYKAEKANNPDAFYPFGYEGDYTASKVRTLLDRQIESMDAAPQSIDVVFSPIAKAYDSWRNACEKKTFPRKFDLKPQKKSWRYMELSVRETDIIPEHYAVWGDGSTPYYALLIEDLKIFDDANREKWIDLRPYRRMMEDEENGWELRGRWRKKSAIPCFKVDKLADSPKNEESVIAIAKLVYPYAVQLSKKPFV